MYLWNWPPQVTDGEDWDRLWCIIKEVLPDITARANPKAKDANGVTSDTRALVNWHKRRKRG